MNLKKIFTTPVKIILIIVVLLIAFRIALPHIVLKYVNKQLNEMEGYSGHVNDIDIHLYRGAYEIEGVEILKTEGNIGAPFFNTDKIDLSIEWKAIFDGSLVGEISFVNPKINFVKGPTEEQTQTGPDDESWQQTVQDLFPLNINRFEIFNGEVHYRDFHSDPQVDIYIHQIDAIATNLTNSLDVAKSLFANINAKGVALKSGEFKLNLTMNPYAEQPTFSLDAELTNLNLVEINNFLQAYGNFDVEKGKFNLFTEMAAAEGKFEGYAKPLLKDVEVFRWKEDHDNFLQGVWEAIVGTVTEIFENQPKDQVATEIPISGKFDDPEIGVWSTIGGLLKNAFIQALVPGIEQKLNLENVKDE